MKLSKRGLIQASVAALCLCSISVAAAQSSKQLRFAEFGPNRGDRADTIKWLDAEMRKRSEGKLGLDIVWGGALLSAKDAAKGLSAGVADMASIVPVYAPGRMVVYEVTDTAVSKRVGRHDGHLRVDDLPPAGQRRNGQIQFALLW